MELVLILSASGSASCVVYVWLIKGWTWSSI